MRQHHLFLAPGALGGEEKAGFGAQPRDFDAMLPCPGDISNNIGGFAASNFKMLFRNPISPWHLAPSSPYHEEAGGGSHFWGIPGYSFICVCVCKIAWHDCTVIGMAISKVVLKAF